MSIEKETWGEYGKLVLNELERLGDNYEKMSDDIDQRFSEISSTISEFRNIAQTVSDQKNWIERVSDVWSPMQMKEAKDEIYKQKNKWVATVAIITALQILLGIGLAVWGNLGKH